MALTKEQDSEIDDGLAYYREVCDDYEPRIPHDCDSACKHCACFDDAHEAKSALLIAAHLRADLAAMTKERDELRTMLQDYFAEMKKYVRPLPREAD